MQQSSVDLNGWTIHLIKSYYKEIISRRSVENIIIDNCMPVMPNTPTNVLMHIFIPHTTTMATTCHTTCTTGVKITTIPFMSKSKSTFSK